MPWETKTVMEQRNEFVRAAQTREQTISALCREYGISRKTGYKWLERAERDAPLTDQSRRPHREPAKTDQETEALILAVRDKNPTWGGKMIRAVLEEGGYTGLPSARTCCAILKRNGRINPEESLRHKPWQRFERDRCNELWQTDFKGDFLLGDGSRCYPLDILDDHSRFCLCIEPKSVATGVKESFIRTFKEYGLPDAVLSDNGAQFSGFRGGYTQFERFLMDLDVAPIHGRIMHPQTQGKIERFHRTMKQEVLRDVPHNMAQMDAQLQQWRWRYNELRPHSALGMKPPGSVYHPSSRKYAPAKPYEYEPGARLVKVNNWGYLRFGPVRLYLSETMADTRLEIRPSDGDTFLVIYRNYKIATVDAASQKLLDRHIRRL